MKLAARVFGVLAGILIVILLAGLLIPGEWEAEADTTLDARPEDVFPYLIRMELWVRWTAVPDAGLEFFGPQEGPGSGVRWNDPRYGSGEVVIREVDPRGDVRYEVLVEGGALRTEGILTLRPSGATSRLHWLERGDFGKNPLLGFAARGMAESQAEAMRAGLERLEALLVPTRPCTSGSAPRSSSSGP